MENISSYILFSVGLVVFIIMGTLLVSFIAKSDEASKLRNTLTKMRRSFNELDEQAKLIIKTDLALNKAQEELDKRLKGLDSLQKTSRLISTTLDEKEIFHRLQKSLLTELGFEKSLIFIFTADNELQSRVNLGLDEEQITFIAANLQKDINLVASLKDGHTFSSANAPQQRRESIVHLFDALHFVLAPILTQNGFIGLVFVGNQSNVNPITSGDQEIISILANQIGQSVENARLFEQVFRSSQILESKVQDRTKQLASALEEVQKISKTKSEFISAVSHELRTPLTSIKGYASLLMTGKLGEVPEGVRKRLEKINTHSDNLVGLINNLLDIARIESGRVEMNMGSCNIENVISNVEDLLTPQMKEKEIQFVSEVDPQIPEMYLDVAQVERIFINLVGNATKFTPQKGTISVKAIWNKEQKHINIEVSDTGIGISQPDIEKLFEEFYKVENEINANLKGTGLGLPLAKKIIEAHGGTIWITSIISEGTTFHFTLPLLNKTS